MSSTSFTGPDLRDKTFRIAFIHPDLGIGGAERLVVDAAVGLQDRGHEVEIFTSWHDPNHCFEQTRDGTLRVNHVKTGIPRAFLSAFNLPLAIMRQFSLTFQLLIALFAFRFPGAIPRFLYRHLTSLPPLQSFDIFIVDQLSACVPALRILTTTRVIFYCHYPDKEVGNSIARQKAIDRGQSGPGLLRTIYRIPFDMLEELTISTSDKIMVNSQFTSNQFIKTFHRLARIPRVVYPGIDLSLYETKKIEEANVKLKAREEQETFADKGKSVTSVKAGIRALIENNDRPTLLSINRFEAKKNIALAIDTFVQVQKENAALGNSSRLRLVLAGGYDYRLQENIITLKELQAQCDAYSLSHFTLFYNNASPSEPSASSPPLKELLAASVIFLPSIPMALLGALLAHPHTRVLLYTPTEEHFGIVPLEAMAVGLPVVATNSGGPMESVVDLSIQQTADTDNGAVVYANKRGTGLLRRPNAKVWGKAALDLLCLNEEQRSQVAVNAKDRTKALFSLQAMSVAFEKCIEEVDEKGPVRSDEGLLQWSIAVGSKSRWL
ncbi:hypothetical protein CBS101457_003753 [Exobasidium rhododendri]|nr:hypothetical protein CBS101457_003753 [Exobasidium rhododendri]